MQPIGEVLSSSITSLVAESWGVDAGQDGTSERPSFGSFLRIDSPESRLTIYAVVFNIVTGPADDLHKPRALRMTHQELKVEQPHIFALLRTEIHAATVGYSADSTIFTRLPPQPPQVHDYVYPAASHDIERLTAGFDFLRLLATIAAVPSDELIAAALRQACLARKHDYSFLVEAGQALSRLFRDDHDRLVGVLRKINPQMSDSAAK